MSVARILVMGGDRSNGIKKFCGRGGGKRIGGRCEPAEEVTPTPRLLRMRIRRGGRRFKMVAHQNNVKKWWDAICSLQPKGDVGGKPGTQRRKHPGTKHGGEARLTHCAEGPKANRAWDSS